MKIKFCAATVLITFAAIASPIYADDSKIRGAFGYELGSSFDPWPSLLIAEPGSQKGADASGELVFRVNPPHPNRLFAQYLVKVSAVTHRIWRISGVAKFDSAREGVEVFNKLREKLVEQYGSPSEKLPNSEFANYYVFKSGARKVVYRFSFESSCQIDISYEDGEIAAQGEKEDRDRAGSLLDFTGL